MSEASPYVVETHSLEETEAFGELLGKALVGGEVIGLIGTLGAGKTRLTKGIARGAGFDESGKVTSPTFVLVNEYPGRVYVYHLDAYRLRSVAELRALGFEEMLERACPVIVEWADRVSELMPPDWLEIRFEVIGASERRLTCTPYGAQSQRLVSAFRAACNDE